jgi:hypothetical protein
MNLLFMLLAFIATAVPFRGGKYLASKALFKQSCIFASAVPRVAMTTVNGEVDVEEYAYDADYPGTSVPRMLAIRQRVRSLSLAQLNGDWESVRRLLLWAGGLRDLPHARPGQGYTGHSFNDFNHCDLTAMSDDVAELDNNGQVEYVARNNPLGAHTQSLNSLFTCLLC